MYIGVEKAEHGPRGLVVSFKEPIWKHGDFTHELKQALRFLSLHFKKGYELNEGGIIMLGQQNPKLHTTEQVQQLFDDLAKVVLSPEVTFLDENWQPLDLKQRQGGQPLTVLVHVKAQLPFTAYDAKTLRGGIVAGEVIGPCSEKSRSGHGTLVVKMSFGARQSKSKITNLLNAAKRQIARSLS